MDKPIPEAARALVAKWRDQAKQHGVRTFTGNDHALFANELESALTAAQQQVGGEVCAEDLRWCEDIAESLQEAGGPTNNMRLVALNRLIRHARTTPPSSPVGVEGFPEVAGALSARSGEDREGVALAAFNATLTPPFRVPDTLAYRLAMMEAIDAAQQRAAVDALPDCPHSALDGCDCYATQHQEPTT